MSLFPLFCSNTFQLSSKYVKVLIKSEDVIYSLIKKPKLQRAYKLKAKPRLYWMTGVYFLIGLWNYNLTWTTESWENEKYYLLLIVICLNVFFNLSIFCLCENNRDASWQLLDSLETFCQYCNYSYKLFPEHWDDA